MQLELVSCKLCPFVQRSVITLLYKNVKHSHYLHRLVEPASYAQFARHTV